MNNRILVLSNSWGGLYSFRKEVFQSLRARGLEVFISCPLADDEIKSKWFENIGCKGITTQFNRQGTNPIADLKLMFTYCKLIKKIKPLAVLSYTIKPNLYGGMACALCKVPQIANITGLGAAVEYPGLMQKFTIMLYKLGLRKTRMTFFQNDTNMQFCKDHGMVNNNVALIPGSGVNLQYHEQKPFPEETEPVRFVFCSRIRFEKGIEEYIAAAQHCFDKGYNTEFIVLGACEGKYENRLNELTQKGVLKYVGSQSDVRPFFAMGQCTIHPTFYPEGMSNVLLESCATGRAIITTNRPGCREIVDDEKNGFVVNQQDSNDLISKVETFLSLPYESRKAMGEAARRKVEKEFDRQIVIDAYLSEINKIKEGVL